MQLNFKEIEYVVGDALVLSQMDQVKALEPFDETVIAFLNALSVRLRSVRQYPDVATFGFWCRKAAVLQNRERYDDLSERQGRGVVFHIAPTNVPVNFAFSFVSGLLAGNANTIRLSRKPFEQIDIICHAINSLLAEEFAGLAPYICMIKYDHNKEITDALSWLCDTRVIWGGDRTIAEIRKSPLKPRTNEINFADRHSIALINADFYLAAEKKERIINDFYNDTYYSDQNACTAPRMIFWTGEQVKEAQRDFWDRVQDLIAAKYTISGVQSIGKLHAMYKVSSAYEIQKEESRNMMLTRLEIGQFDEHLMDYKYNSGFFFEKTISSLQEMLPICTKPCQTLTYLGIDPATIASFIRECRPAGIDRAVPMGKSMDFDLVWDGYDLIREMSRKISII